MLLVLYDTTNGWKLCAMETMKTMRTWFKDNWMKLAHE